MSLHIKDVTSQVEVTGVPSAGPGPAGKPRNPPSWEEQERFRQLAEKDRAARRRVCGEGFDG